MPNIFERSLIRAGDGGLVLVIPKSWVTYHCLKPGDILRVKTNGNLVVEPTVLGKWKKAKKPTNLGN